MKPLVSILILAYNAEQWLPETVRSAIAQTWDNKEIIIIDDGSKDQTLKIARQFYFGHRHHTPRELARAEDRGPTLVEPQTQISPHTQISRLAG